MLLIDIGLTLLGGPEKSPSTFLVELFSLPSENKSAVADLVFCREHESPGHLMDDLTESLRLKPSREQADRIERYWHSQVQECRPLPGVGEFCDYLITAAIPYAIVSNLWRPFHAALSHYLPAFERNARQAFLSYKLGARKPGKAFYDAVYNGIGESPSDMLMLGDSLHNDIIPCLERGTSAVLLQSWRFTLDPSRKAELKTNYPRCTVYTARDYHDCRAILAEHFTGEHP